MRRSLPLLVFLFLASSSIQGQEYLPEGDYRYVETATVYNALITAMQPSREAPTLQLYNGKHYGAVTLPDRRIIIDTYLYDLTRTMGADSNNALAWILGHELGHFYNEDYWCYNMSHGMGISDTAFAHALRDQDPTRSDGARSIAESKADVDGTLSAHLADFSAISVASRILTAIYDSYLDGKDPEGYPPFETRLQHIEYLHTEMAGELLPQYDMAVRLLAIGRYGPAIEIFDRLTQVFASPEMFLNRGTAYAMEALSLMSERPRYRFPIELDMNSRLQRFTIAGTGSEETDRVTELLENARQDFEKAAIRDPLYIVARRNLASAMALMPGETSFYNALGVLDEARKKAVEQNDQNEVALCDLLMGIIHAMRNEKDAAAAKFDAARSALPNNPDVQHNYAVFRGEETELDGDCSKVIPAGSEKFSGKTAAALVAGISADTFEPLYDGSDMKWMTDKREGISISGVRFVEDDNEQTVWMVRVLRGYTGATAHGITLGSFRSDVVDEYGCPTVSRRAKQGSWDIYPRAALAFLYDADGKVTEWMIWIEE